MEGLTFRRNILNWRLEVKRIGIAITVETGHRGFAVSAVEKGKNKSKRT